ncbi:hypothetical protein AZE42_06454, partial [Rhizopogon vesiculosus]
GNDFWGKDANHTHRQSDPLAGPSSPIRQRNLFDFLRFSTRLASAPQRIALQPWKFRFSPVRPSMHAINVAPARDEDRYVVEPPSEAEVAAAMQDTSYNSSTQQSQGAAGTQGSQVYMQERPIQTVQRPHSDTGTGELSYVIGCCGFYLSHLDMSLILTDDFCIVFGYFAGSCRASRMSMMGLTPSLVMVSQLHPLSQWYTIGVSRDTILR